ncbi:MAG: hypothetical protein IAF38_22520 [Bacteroidia bacterium]|nr:hypothetical protein [Bacteroidia bacterium]
MKAANNDEKKNKGIYVPLIKFLEFSRNNSNQHFITVLGEKQGEVLGRIFREYDKENKRMKYFAKDINGDPMFPEEFSLKGLKRLFIQKSRDFTQSLAPPLQTGHEEEQPEIPVSYILHEKKLQEKEKQVKEIRESKEVDKKEKNNGKSR